MPEKFSYAIIGTGALGGTYGIKLANAGFDVHFLANSDFNYIKQNGLQLHSEDGRILLEKVSVFQTSKDIPKVNVVCICLKTTQNHLLKEILDPIVHKDTIILTLQNGLGIEEELNELFPQAIIVGGLCYLCSNKTGPGNIVNTDMGRIAMGSMNSKEYPNVIPVSEDFINAGIKIDLVENLILERWKKLLWNIPFNGLSVVLNSTTDKIIQQESTKQLAYELMLELIDAAKANGYEIHLEFAQKMIALTEKMKPYKTSMMLDFENKRSLELQYMFRNPIQKAKEKNTPMKKVETLEKLLSYIQNSYTKN